MKPVLVTDGGGGQNRSALGAVRALASAGHPVHVTTSGKHSVAGWSRHCHRRVPVPQVGSPGYVPAITQLVHEHDYAYVFPASDASLIALSLPGHFLVDKTEVTRRAAAAGFPVLPEWTFTSGAELRERADELTYPVAIKVIAKAAAQSASVQRADGPADLTFVEKLTGPLMAQEWVESPMRAVTGVMWGGRLRAVAHQQYLRTWPPACGVASAAATVEPDIALEERLTFMLSDHEGLFQVQLVGNHLIDINPRVYGSLPLAARAGVNYADIVCRLASGQQVGKTRPLRARVGVRYRWVEGDLRHLALGLRRRELTWREVATALRPAPGSALGDVSLSDPAPTLARFLHVARGQR